MKLNRMSHLCFSENWYTTGALFAATAVLSELEAPAPASPIARPSCACAVHCTALDGAHVCASALRIKFIGDLRSGGGETGDQICCKLLQCRWNSVAKAPGQCNARFVSSTSVTLTSLRRRFQRKDCSISVTVELPLDSWQKNHDKHTMLVGNSR